MGSETEWPSECDKGTREITRTKRWMFNRAHEPSCSASLIPIPMGERGRRDRGTERGADHIDDIMIEPSLTSKPWRTRRGVRVHSSRRKDLVSNRKEACRPLDLGARRGLEHEDTRATATSPGSTALDTNRTGRSRRAAPTVPVRTARRQLARCTVRCVVTADVAPPVHLGCSRRCCPFQREANSHQKQRGSVWTHDDARSLCGMLGPWP